MSPTARRFSPAWRAPSPGRPWPGRSSWRAYPSSTSSARSEVALPHAGVWTCWIVGMTLHLLVGAIWAVFYAYFFWSALPLRPVLQGLLFAFVPMPLAILIMHPQLELMTPIVQEGGAPPSGLFGLSGGWHEPLSIAMGHLIWGAVLGLLYTRPVGYAANRPPDVDLRRRQQEHIVARASEVAEDRFMFATGIECSYPTLEGGRWRMDQMAACGHYRHWQQDLELVRDLGLSYLRYGPPMHLIHEGSAKYNWAFFDEIGAEMQRLGIVPIMDLCHFGVPDWLQNF